MARRSKKSDPREVGKRWTDELVVDGWTPVSDFFLTSYHKLGINSLQAMFLIHLMKYKWDKNMPYPKFRTLAKHMGLSDAAVRTHARTLESKGYLRRLQRRGEANRFDLVPLFEALETLRAAEEKAKITAGESAAESSETEVSETSPDEPQEVTVGDDSVPF